MACLTWAAAASAQDVPKILGTQPGEWRLSLPAAYQRELDRVAPGIAIITDERYVEFPQGDSASSPSVRIRDLNGDRRPEVFLAGFTGDSVVVVVGLITSPTAVTGRILHRRARAKYELRRVDEILSVQKERGRTWIRWQSDDCKTVGWEFRVVGQKAITRKSRCTYGE